MIGLPRTKGAKCTTQIEIEFLLRPLWRMVGILRGKIAARTKKTGRKIEFSSRVEVRDCGPESFRGCYRALGLNASFFSLSSTLFPPFNPQSRRFCEELGMTSLTPSSVVITFFLSTVFLANVKIFLQAHAR